MNDTTRRFLSELLTQVREDGLIELRLFPALRQGGMESGLAVIAVEPGSVGPQAVDADLPDAPSVHLEEDTLQLSDSAVAAVDGAENASAAYALDEAPDDASDAESADQGEDAAHPEGSAPDAQHEGIPVFHRADSPRTRPVERSDNVQASDSQLMDQQVQLAESGFALSATGSADQTPEQTDDHMALGDILALPSPVESGIPVSAEADNRRLAILTARYKLTVRGPDRGRWDMEVVHEADAPLITLDRVIKGVVRRSGEGADPETYSARSLRDALDAPAWLEPD